VQPNRKTQESVYILILRRIEDMKRTFYYTMFIILVFCTRGQADMTPVSGSAKILGGAKSVAGSLNIATLVSGVIFGSEAKTQAEANLKWAQPNPDEDSGRFLATADSSITATCTAHTPAHTAASSAHAHAANAIGGLGWIFTHETSAIAVATGKCSGFALAFARNSTGHKAKVSQASVTADWSVTYGYEVVFGVTTNLSDLGYDPVDPPELTSLEVIDPIRIERGGLKSLNLNYEFGFTAVRETVGLPANPIDTRVFYFDVGLDPVSGLQISGDLDSSSPEVTVDPDLEADGIDWLEIYGSYTGQFTISGSVTRDPWPAGGVDVYFDTYSQMSGDDAVVAEPASLALAVIGLSTVVTLVHRRRALC
jgi:hypothetical protein